MIVTALSICKEGFLHLIVSPENFTLLQGQDNLSCYTFSTKAVQHTFCSVCGIHLFYDPRSHPNMIDINIRCLDKDLSQGHFDGQNWEDNIEQIR